MNRRSDEELEMHIFGGTLERPRESIKGNRTVIITDGGGEHQF